MRSKITGFRECNICSNRVGSSTLCASCLNNQALISQLEADENRIDFIQSLLKRKKCILRMSQSGRGFRLHESDREGGEHSVRLAIDNFMRTFKDSDT